MTDQANDKFVTVGRFGTPYGVKGWMKIHSFTDPVENLLEYHPWYMKKNNQWHELKLSGKRKHHKGIVAAIEGCDAKEATAEYRNLEIAVTRDALPALAASEYYWTDLEGLSVTNLEGDYLGNIESIFETGANDVLVVKDGKTERLLPYKLDVVIKQIDLQHKTMLVDWDKDF